MHSMRYATRTLLAVLVLGALLLGAQPPPIRAQEDCDALVIDAAEVFGTQRADVQAAAEELSSKSQLVRVRTVSSFAPASSLEAYASQLEQRCGTWRTADGKRQPDLLLVLLAREERRTGIYYGASWTATLYRNATAIQNDVMNPRFKAGDFAGGFVAGLRRLDQVLASSSSQGSGGTAATAPTPIGPGLGYCGGILALLVGLIGGGFGLRRRRRSQQALHEAQQRASQIKRRIVELIVGLPKQMEELELRIKLLATEIAAEEAAPFTALLGDVQRTQQVAVLAFDSVQQTDPEGAKARLSLAQYESLTERYGEVLPLVERAAQIAAQVRAYVARIDQVLEQLPARLSEQQRAQAEARAAVDRIAAAGFAVTTQQALLEQAAAALQQAEQAQASRHMLRANELVTQASQLSTQAAEQAEALPAIQQQLSDDLQQLEQRSAAAAALIADGEQAFSAISGAYSRPNWDAIVPNMPEAERLYASSQQTIAAAQAAATMQRQDWPTARAQADQAAGALGQIEELIAAIHKRQTEISAAQASIPQLIAAAHQERATVEAELQQYRADTPETVWSELRSAAADLSTAEALLQQPQPDYLALTELVERSRGTAQRARDEARAAFKAAELQRQHAAAALQAAASLITQAEQLIQHGGSDVSGAASSDLRAARAALQQAERSSDLKQRLEYTSQAHQQAQAAFDRARREIDAAQDQRDAAAAAVTIAASSHTHSHSSSGSSSDSSSGSSSGGASSWDSSSGGGSSWDNSSGGASSWDSGSSSGSSSDGGGSSTGW